MIGANKKLQPSQRKQQSRSSREKNDRENIEEDENRGKKMFDN
jgi:hypothetical protein